MLTARRKVALITRSIFHGTSIHSLQKPGAMWGSTLAIKWGGKHAVTLNDGKGQGNNITVFPTKCVKCWDT
ncbi:hypothetical protein ABIF78_001018 [Bradyrhizobium japonicum]